LHALAGWLRRTDAAAAARVDAYATLSSDVRERLRQCYDRDAALIYPPVDTRDFRPGTAADPGHFLWVHRMVPYKQPLLVARSFAGLPYRLTMVGVGPLAERVAAQAPPNVTVRGWLERDELADLYAGASAFIHVGEEDFGITRVEARAAGLPVVALDRGGSRDIVRDGRHGVLIGEASEAALRAALERCAATTWDPAALAAQASRFSRERFVEGFRAFAERKAAEKAALRSVA
jgi:glycosyltransferase involved in cell wall biosynthesis